MAVRHHQEYGARWRVGHLCERRVGAAAVCAGRAFGRGVGRKGAFAGVDPGQVQRQACQHPRHGAAHVTRAEQHDMQLGRYAGVDQPVRIAAGARVGEQCAIGVPGQQGAGARCEHAHAVLAVAGVRMQGVQLGIEHPGPGGRRPNGDDTSPRAARLCMRQGRIHPFTRIGTDGLERQFHDPAAALAHTGAEREAVHTGADRGVGDHRARQLDRAQLQLPATDAARAVLRPDDHVGAGCARGRAAGSRHRHQHGRPVAFDAGGEIFDPWLHVFSLAVRGGAGRPHGTGLCGPGCTPAAASAWRARLQRA